MRLVYGTKQNFLSWEDSVQVLDYQGLEIIGHQITGILLCVSFPQAK